MAAADGDQLTLRTWERAIHSWAVALYSLIEFERWDTWLWPTSCESEQQLNGDLGKLFYTPTHSRYTLDARERRGKFVFP